MAGGILWLLLGKKSSTIFLLGRNRGLERRRRFSVCCYTAICLSSCSAKFVDSCPEHGYHACGTVVLVFESSYYLLWRVVRHHTQCYKRSAICSSWRSRLGIPYGPRVIRLGLVTNYLFTRRRCRSCEPIHFGITGATEPNFRLGRKLQPRVYSLHWIPHTGTTLA